MYNDYETIYQSEIPNYFGFYFLIIISLIFIIITLIGLSNIFKKASIKKIYAYIPFLNLYKILEICGISKIHMLLIFIPIINIITNLKISFALSECFNKKKSFSWILFFFPFIGYPILGLTNEKYIGINNKKVKTIVIEELKKEEVNVTTPSEIVKKDINISLGTNDVKKPINNTINPVNEPNKQESELVLEPNKQQSELVLESNEPKEIKSELVMDTNILNKPERDNNEFVECPHCHKKVKKINDTCFWCGGKLD